MFCNDRKKFSAYAGRDKIVEKGVQVILLGQVQEGAHPVISYEWKLNNGAVLATTKDLTYLFTDTGAKTFVFKATNERGDEVSDDVTITVSCNKVEIALLNQTATEFTLSVNKAIQQGLNVKIIDEDTDIVFIEEQLNAMQKRYTGLTANTVYEIQLNVVGSELKKSLWKG